MLQDSIPRFELPSRLSQGSDKAHDFLRFVRSVQVRHLHQKCSRGVANEFGRGVLCFLLEIR